MNMNRRWIRGFLAITLCTLFVLPSAFAAPKRVAVLVPENKTGDPRYDYLGGMAFGLLSYDLSSSGLVDLVDRSVLDAALRERELSLSAIAEQSASSVALLASADWLLAGEYLLLGNDLLLTLKLVEVGSSKVSTYVERGATEDLIHLLAERIAERISSTKPSFASGGQSRSIFTLRDETPGSIALHSPLVDAEIFLDGSFVAYTRGDRRLPIILEGISPGKHTLSTDLGQDFGVVKLPEISFAPWSTTLQVQAGKRLVVMDETTHFNAVIYRLMDLVSESAYVDFDAKARYAQYKDFVFTDRKGRERRGRVGVQLQKEGEDTQGGAQGSSAATDSPIQFSGKAFYMLDGTEQELALNPVSPTRDEYAASLAMDIVSFEVKVENRYGRIQLSLGAERNDIHQGMHRE